MTYYELIKLSKPSIDRLSEAGFRLNDCRYIPLYEDYLVMRSRGEKKTYIVSVLSERHKVCERKVYSLIRLFEKCCTLGAV